MPYPLEDKAISGVNKLDGDGVGAPQEGSQYGT